MSRDDFHAFYEHLLTEVYHEPDSMLTTQDSDRMILDFLNYSLQTKKILDLGLDGITQ